MVLIRKSRLLAAPIVFAAEALAAAPGAPPALPASPCPTAPEWRQFDFWLGEWDVHDSLDGGKVVARSTIDKSTNDCIVHEHYVEVDGYSGRSVSFFDATLHRWRQTWVDSIGNVGEFSGEYRDGAMRFEGETHVGANGRKVLRRMTLSNLANGHVRQLSQRSSDAGKTWSVNYDYEYVRRSPGS